MKKLYLFFVMLFATHTLFSQILYKEGIVKGKHVTYEVSRGKDGHYTFIRNMNNPDTTSREEPRWDTIPRQLEDVKFQVAEMVHDYLSQEEIDTMEPTCMLGVTLRLDTRTRKLLQVTNFYYFRDEPFWANFSPDRLYELEQIILRKLELPTILPETFFGVDFDVRVYGFYFQNIENVREARKAAIKAWQRKDRNKEQEEPYIRHVLYH